LNKNISDKDKKDWENFLSKKETLPDKDFKIDKNNKLGESTIDLHGYNLDEANKKIKDLILKSYKQQVSRLKVITGKGLHSKNENDPYISKDFGILKNSVPEYIKNNNELIHLVKEIKEAEIKDGGSGAFYIYLKKKL
tara:strand:- start:451 stop:864 length:414 start_codon:yes stop_codon:yes gene_type:complete